MKLQRLRELQLQCNLSQPGVGVDLISSNFVTARINAGLTQEELAQSAGVDLKWVRLAENSCVDVAIGVMNKLVSTLNVSISDIFSKVPLQLRARFEAGDPYSSLIEHSSLILSYFKTFEGCEKNEVDRFISHVMECVVTFKRKPVVGLSGRFDSGKSTLINTLLGENILPTAYQPMTHIPTFVVHTDCRPKWLKDDEFVAIFPHSDLSKVIASDSPNDALFVGGKECLFEATSHRGGNRSEASKLAVVFSSNKVLKTCSFLDLPGYSHDNKDKLLAVKFQKSIDILIYTSPLISCMDQSDLLYLNQHLTAMGQPFHTFDSFPTLSNLFLVITRCGREESDEDIKDAIDILSLRMYKHYTKTLVKKLEQTTRRDINLEILRSRIFPFSTESTARRDRFIYSLNHVLEHILPNIWIELARKGVSRSIDASKIDIRRLRDEVRILLEKQEEAQENYEILSKNMPKIKSKCDLVRNRTEIKCSELSEISINKFKCFYSEIVNVASLVKEIDTQYDSRAKAEKHLSGYIYERLSAKAGDVLAENAETFSTSLEESLSDLHTEIRASLPPILDCSEYGVEFDVSQLKNIFFGGIVGLGSFGALSVWAAIAAAGSNLGAYVLVAKVAGLLSLVGLNVGSAALVSLVAALGGPIVVATGLGLLVAAGAWLVKWLIDPTWQEMLAEKLISHLTSKKAEEKFCSFIEKYWVDTNIAAASGLRSIEEHYEDKLQELRSVANPEHGTLDSLRSRMDSYDNLLCFFEDMPRFLV